MLGYSGCKGPSGGSGNHNVDFVLADFSCQCPSGSMIETNFTHVALRLGGAPMKGQTDTQIIVEAFPECVCV